MSRGILMFAHNNGLFDYGKMAYAAGCAAAHYIRERISLVTDEQTWEDLWNLNPYVGDFFDDVIMTESDSKNRRHFDMADGSTEKAPYHNTSRFRAYELSPYDETLVLDTDYLVQDRSLADVWGSPAPVRMNRQISELVKHDHGPHHTVQILDGKGMETMWATVVYFRRDPVAEQLYTVAEYVEENYAYYGALYGFPTNLTRVDFVMTVAAHLLSGYLGGQSVIDPLPVDNTVFAWNKDIMVDVGMGKATFACHSSGGNMFPVVVRRSVHCMNKDSMLALADRIIDCYA